ncbi:biotin transporter BioY [Paenibacillus sp. S-38]|uniref:biotin transporter BioY n=1 Tax=Paenibacillus sp. S-38 TaxID=3416710 RepID=UPI003CF39A6B
MKTSISIRGLVFSTLFGALFVASSFFNIHLGFSPVPISFQNLVVMLAGLILGPVYGFISIGLVVLLTAAGLPLMHGSGGPTLLLGKTGGFIWAYPFAALLIGWVSERVQGRGVWTFVRLFLAAEVFGSLLLYVTGVPWLAHVANLPMQKAMVAACYPFLPGDAVKAVLAALIALQIRQVFPASRLR